MRFSILATILVLMAATGYVNAQTDTARRETTVIFFGSERAAEKANSKYDANAVKLGIFEMIQGLYGFTYERELSDIFTVQGGLSLTGRNWTYGLLGEDGFGPSAEDQKSTYFGDNDYIDEDYNFKTRKAKLGYAVAVMPKFYYADEDGMDGRYLGLNFQYRRYNYAAYGNIVNSYGEFESGNNISEFENQTILSLAWGYQNLNEKTAIDYHFAAGIRSITGERRDLGVDLNSTSGELILAPTPRKTSGSYFFLEIGLKVGLWWKNK